MKKLTLQLEIDEINTILAALGNMPYAKVYALVEKINEQAAPQIAPAANGKPAEN